ncbi:MAG TPA: hypothetical protein PKW56_04460 [Clostridiales bacterium]|nr:hypothetical protein [Clostridiales bacterium]
MKKIIVLILSLSGIVFSSTFNLKYGGPEIEIGYDAAQTSDGGFIIAGITNSIGTEIGDYDGYLIKTDQNGIMEWEEMLPGQGVDSFIKVRQTSDGGYIVLGRNNFRILDESNECFPWLVKYDDTGKLKWEDTYEELNADLNISDFIIADDEGFLVLGSKKTSISTCDAWLMKTDSHGRKIWEKVYDSQDIDEGVSITRNFSGGYLLVCNSGDQVWAIHIDQTGEIIQEGIINYSSDNKLCTSICATTDSSFVMTGYVNSGEQPPPPTFPPDPPVQFNQGCCILKFSSNLNTEWMRYYNVPDYNYLWINSICNSNEDGFTFIGTNNNSLNDLFITKVDNAGNFLWERFYGNSYDDQGTGNIIRSSDNSYVFCGMADLINNYPEVSSQVYLIKTDSDGYVIYPPVITSFENDSNNVSINWEAVSNAGSYIVYGSDRPDSNFTAIDTTAVNSWNTAQADSLNKKFYYIKASTDPVSK